MESFNIEFLNEGPFGGQSLYLSIWLHIFKKLKFLKILLSSLSFNFLPNPFEIAFRAVCRVNLLVIDLKFTKQSNLSSIFSIWYMFLTKIVGGDNVNNQVTKITMPQLYLLWYLTMKLKLPLIMTRIHHRVLDSEITPSPSPHPPVLSPSLQLSVSL